MAASAARATKASPAYVKQMPYSIGYVEDAYVIQNKMAYAVMQNAAGKFVAPSAPRLRRRRRPAPIGPHAKDFNLVMTNAPGAERPTRSPRRPSC